MAPVEPGVVYLCLLAVVTVTILLVSIFCKEKKGKKDEPAAARRNIAERQPVDNVPRGARQRVRPRGRRMMNRDDDSAEGSEGDEEDMFGNTERDGKIGAKKQKKLEEKAEKKANRIAVEQEREDKKKRDALLEKQRLKEEEIQKAQDEEEAKQEQLRKEEEEKREHEEYLKLKAAFTVDDEGEEDIGPDLSSQSLLQEFIDYIKEMKVIMLEDLASHFKIKTQDAINRVQELQEEGRLTGVIDDRGKFIYITMEELESVAKYIKQHGRVSISDLAESSNRLINLNPDNSEVQIKLMSEVSG
ncbi:DDRGK domain-containing protein 1-like [Mytilus trossulus]|uniref:DDRGK domain-containing protein 1-like n=1 Tax=Mytilus trossulus TaxID=6551 RepID=UPI0030066184